jgi:hypothetical protein
MMDVRVIMREQPDGKWVAVTDSTPPVRATGSSPERCLAGLRRALDRDAGRERRDGPLTLIVESAPLVAGVAEAAEVMGWDKRRVVTYIDRGRFPEPLQSLASGRIWLRSEVERFAREWRSRRAGRGGVR